MVEKLTVPVSFCLQPFYLAGDTIPYNRGSFSFEEGICHVPFICDIAYSERVDQIKPWENTFVYVPVIFNHWYTEKESIALLFRKRDKQSVVQPMIQQLANWIDALFWINKHPVIHLVNWVDEIDNLALKPINSKERLAFMLERPDHYHSFIQLAELYEELRKLYEKSLIISQKENP